MNRARRPSLDGLLGGLRALRARQWRHFAVLPLAGLDLPRLGSAAGWWRAALALGVASLILGYAYGLNAVTDRATDHSGRKNPLRGQGRLPWSVWAVLGATLGAALLGARALEGEGFGWASLALVASTLYSAGPRLKRWPLVGTLCNAAIFAPLLFLLRDDRSAPLLPLHAVTFLGLILQNQLLHELADAAEDASARTLTTARLLGEPRTRRLVAALALPFVGLAFRVAPPASLVAPLVASLALLSGAVIALRVPSAAAGRRWHRRASLLLCGALFVGGLCP